MARQINADLKYALYYDEWDWTEITGRSYTRWSSGNNYDGGSTYQQGDMRMTYDPAQEVVVMLNQMLMRRFRAEMGFRAVVLRANWYYRYGGSDGGSGSFTTQLREVLKSLGYPDLSDCTYEEKDASVADWFGSGYAPQLGKDVGANTIAQVNQDQTGMNNGDLLDPYDITEYFAKQLLDNEDLWFELTQITSSSTFWVGTSVTVERPKMLVDYFFPVEMFPVKSDGTGDIDLSALLNTDDNPINLGAYQRNQIGSGIEFKLKNFSGSVINHIELWDNWPEWTTPVADSGNAGSAVLAYVSPYEACRSQRWEVKFLTVTQYEVKADAYLDQIDGLHPQYDADSTWQKLVSQDFESPGGDIQIPSAVWSGTAVAGDIFVFYTVGNTTDAGWPADSNDQVEMAEDNVGSPGTWRPINAQRTLLTVGDTVDAATITVTVKRIDTTKWVVGTAVYLADSANIDIGTIKSVTATTVEIENLSVTSNAYVAGAIVATTLPFRSLATTPWAQLTATSGVSESSKDRLYIDNADTHGFTQSNVVVVQSLDDPTKFEEITIQGITSTYLDLASDMVNDYEVGATVIEVDTGEISFWLRIVAGGATDEEKKEFRLAVVA